MSELHGTFISKSDGGMGNSSFVLLTLNSDSSFKLKEGSFEIISQCTGKWRFTKQNAIQLKCSFDTSVLNNISAGYMSERERILKIKSRNELLLGNISLLKTSVNKNE
jgi:hypothetical protein